MKFQFKSVRNGLALAVLAIALGGCTSDTEGRDERGFAPHLTVDLSAPAPADAQSEVLLSVEVKKNGQPLLQADQAEFVVWPEDDPAGALTVPAREQTPGVYAANYVFGAEGLYIVQSRIASANLEAMPAKRVAIGEEAVERLSQLEHAGDEEVAIPEGGHHGH
ncbi:FixH family protein [Cohnella cellulosilytica]|uniref:FixH family protein n=1 Tax=Cohnella cellulosilytica TaxID=986710 RepID=A0ABW2FEI6_9BACL